MSSTTCSAEEIQYDTVLVDSSNYETLLHQGQFYQNLGKWDLAVKFFEKAIVCKPNSVLPLLALGALYRQITDLPKTIYYLQNVLAVEPNNLAARQNLSITLTDHGTHLKLAGHIEEGMKMYLESLSNYVEYAPAHYNIGVIFSEQGKFEEALKHYRNAVKYDPKHVEAYCNMGVIYKQLGQMTDAVQCYREALKAHPNLFIASTNLAIVLTDMGTEVKNAGDIKKSFSYYKEALYFNYKYSEAHYNLGVAYATIGKFERASTHYKLAIEFNPNCVMAMNNLGVLEKNCGRLDMSMEYYKAVLKINPDYAQTLNNIAGRGFRMYDTCHPCGSRLCGGLQQSGYTTQG
eukprot:TRINITY_DN12091_c0_g1_i1.p1 TRINITY_DN12091_c0_g1~~TRINITY_DN12091_c0_g1_i1.p1  ORF type:complete len:347 (+),score=55.63 TRINITY_DN12091_c0_g1_i1:740-1780(+)